MQALLRLSSVAFLFLLQNAAAADIVLKDGTVLTDAKILRAEAGEARIMHSGGIARVPIASLPDEVAKDLPVALPAPASHAPSSSTPSAAVADGTPYDAHLSEPPVILIKGDGAAGSGFVADVGGKHYLYTAVHVLAGADNPTFKLPDGKQLPLPPMSKVEISDDPEIPDVVRIPLTTPLASAFQLVTGTGMNAPVTAYGNSDGENVKTALEGKIIAVGPNEIEIDCQVIGGNSGGPVVRKGSNAVVGLVTRAVKRPTDIWRADTPFDAVRRFAARPERVKKWAHTTLYGIREQGKRITRMRTDTLAIAAVLHLDYYTDGVTPPAKPLGDFSVRDVLKAAAETKTGAAINSAVTTLNASLRAGSRMKLSEVASKQIYSRFFGSIQQAARADITDTSASDFFSYHRQAYEIEVDLRKAVTAEMLKIAGEVHGAAF